jgi:hypothetical protein
MSLHWQDGPYLVKYYLSSLLFLLSFFTFFCSLGELLSVKINLLCLLDKCRKHILTRVSWICVLCFKVYDKATFFKGQTKHHIFPRVRSTIFLESDETQFFKGLIKHIFSRVRGNLFLGSDKTTFNFRVRRDTNFLRVMWNLFQGQIKLLSFLGSDETKNFRRVSWNLF